MSVTDLLDIEVSIPPRPLVDRFDSIVAPMFGLQEALTDESKTLAELHDTLLPKLVSGEIRLQAERAFIAPSPSIGGQSP